MRDEERVNRHTHDREEEIREGEKGKMEDNEMEKER